MLIFRPPSRLLGLIKLKLLGGLRGKRFKVEYLLFSSILELNIWLNLMQEKYYFHSLLKNLALTEETERPVSFQRLLIFLPFDQINAFAVEFGFSQYLILYIWVLLDIISKHLRFSGTFVKQPCTCKIRGPRITCNFPLSFYGWLHSHLVLRKVHNIQGVPIKMKNYHKHRI